MSHSKLRKENNCLNCDAIVDGRYCKNCGQENVEPKQSLWHLVTHFFNDITHFDGKFFDTMKPLILKPGFLSSEYVKGRRMKYLDPIRMYLFISAAFFILMFSITTESHYITRHDDALEYHIIDSMRVAMKDSALYGIRGENIQGKNFKVLLVDDIYRHGVRYYDSVQRAMPDSSKSGWFDRWGERKLAAMYAAYDEDPYNFFEKGWDKFMHSISKIAFISLPIFALFLYLLYIRRRNQYYYVSHAIFALHFYCVLFFFFLIGFLFSNKYYTIPVLIDILVILIPIGLFAYLYIAMLRFYKQHWFKTFLKFSILSFSIVIVILIIALSLLVNSYFAVGAH